MNQNDKAAFLEVMNTACKTLGKPLFDEDSLNLYFAILEPYTFEQVQQALFKSLSTQDSKFGITPALIVKFLGVKEARDLSWQDVIEMARNPKTPMAVLARIHIKSHYLNSFQPMEIKHRADTFLDELEEHKARALAGEYTEHEIVTMIDHKVKVSTPFMEGMPTCADKVGLRAKYEKAIKSPLHVENVARIESRDRNGLTDLDGQQRALSEIKGLLDNDSLTNTFSDVQPKKEYTGAEAAQILEDDLK